MSVYLDRVDAARKKIIEDALQEHHGCRSETARALGLQRTYLQTLIREHNIQIPAQPRGKHDNNV